MRRFGTVLWAGLVLAAPVAAPGFEGTVKLRTVMANRERLAKMMAGKAPDAQQTLQITGAQLTAAKDVGAQVRDNTLYVSGSKVRMDAPGDKGKGGYVIVDTSSETTWLVMPAEKRYMEITEAEAKEMGEKMGQMLKAMKDRLASMPPEQRAQVEAMLKKMEPAEGGAAAKPVEPKAIGKTQTIDGMQTTGYETKAGDETIVAWVTQDQPELAKTYASVQDRMGKLAPAPLRDRQATLGSIAAKGFPLLVQSLDPKQYRIEEVVSVDQKPVDATLFSVPADFTKVKAGEAMKGAPGAPGAVPQRAAPAGH